VLWLRCLVLAGGHVAHGRANAFVTKLLTNKGQFDIRSDQMAGKRMLQCVWMALFCRQARITGNRLEQNRKKWERLSRCTKFTEFLSSGFPADIFNNKEGDVAKLDQIVLRARVTVLP
jgi:hypothetical protein